MGKNDSSSMDDSLFRVPPYNYLHVLDQTTNVTRVEVGPQTFIRKDNEKVDCRVSRFSKNNFQIWSLFVKVLVGPAKMIIIPPRHFCVIKNPAARDPETEVSPKIRCSFGNLSKRQKSNFRKSSKSSTLPPRPSSSTPSPAKSKSFTPTPRSGSAGSRSPCTRGRTFASP